MPDTWNLVLLILRTWLGVVIFVHGASHLMATVRGRKRADYFDALGVRPGNVHAWTVTIVELAVAEVLVAGLVTPIAAGVLGALMLVSLVTDNRNRGFFVGPRARAGSSSRRSVLPRSPWVRSVRASGRSTTRRASRSRSRLRAH